MARSRDPVSARAGPSRSRAGSAILALSVLALAAALAAPRIENTLLGRRLDDVSRSVDAMVTAAGRYHDAQGAWPPSDGPGTMPPTLAPFLAAEVILSRPGYALEWNLWDAVSPSPPVTPAGPPGVDQAPGHLPPPALQPLVGHVAGVTVHTSDGRLLGLLLQRYGGARSFVRDSTWTLLVARPREGR